MHIDRSHAAARARVTFVLATLAAPLACGDDDGGGNATTNTETDTGSTDDGPDDDTTLTSSPTSVTDPDSSSTDPTDGSATSDESSTGAEASLLERVVAALGGADTFDALAAFEVQASGQRATADEGYDPHDTAEDVSTYDVTVSVDIANDGMRLDYERTIIFAMAGVPLSFSEIVSGQLGVVEGVDNLFGAPGGAMPSDRWSSTRRQQQMLNPHLWIKQAVADPTIATETGEEEYDGRPHELLELTSSVAPITLWVDSETNLVSRLTTLENNWLRRDVPVEVRYDDWQATDGGVLFPNHVTLIIDGYVIADETRSAVTTDVAFAPETFAIPDEAGATYVEEDATRGERNQGILQQFATIGVPSFGLTTFVDGAEIAPGVWYLTGGSHHSVLVEQDGGLVLFETPQYEARCVAMLDWIDANLPGQTVTHAVVSHYHVDHAACARTLVARGATLVVGEGSDVVWDDVLTRPSTIEPDELEASPVANPVVEYVPNGGVFTIEDATRPVAVYDLANSHSDDMVLPFVGNGGVGYVADLYNNGTPFQLFGPAGAQAILDTMEANGILGAVNVVAAAHGAGIDTVADLQAVAAGG